MGDDHPSSAGRFRLWIDDGCITAGQCVLIDPELFGFDDHDGTTRVLMSEVTAERLLSASTAVENCPMGAIHLEATT